MKIRQEEFLKIKEQIILMEKNHVCEWINQPHNYMTFSCIEYMNTLLLTCT